MPTLTGVGVDKNCVSLLKGIAKIDTFENDVNECNTFKIMHYVSIICLLR